MKFKLGTKFHTHFIENGQVQLDQPMYGEVINVDKERYEVSWVYSKKTARKNFAELYSEHSFKKIMESMDEQEWITQIPVVLPEDLFTL